LRTVENSQLDSRN